METRTAPGPADELLDALLRADHIDAAHAVDTAFDNGWSAVTVLDDVLTPAMHEIGRRWEVGEIGIAEEHLASSVAHRTLSQVAPMLITDAARTRPRVLLAGAQGERHVLGLQMACDVLEGAGYDVHFAGPDLPASALLAYVERERPAIVALGSTCSWAAAADIRGAIVALLDAQPSLSVLLGGAGWDGFELPDAERVVRVERLRDLLPLAARAVARA